ncbi:hypothetical protein C0995_003538 [Termitomyces sp. Mi166|nr:hypothetical protein C0995_003538 [Termitomyces sp. Mi166\
MQREKIGSTLPDDLVHVIKNELNNLERESDKLKASAVVVSADAVASRLRRSNQRPTSDQVSVLKTLLAQKNSELAKIESNVLNLQLKINDCIGAMKALEQFKYEKQAEANFCESWLVSARLLPLEVLTRILRYAIGYCGPSTKARTSPLSLSHVCSSWRSSALGYSNFWNDLELHLSNFHKNNEPHVIGSLLDLWYGRANRSRALSLSLRASEYIGVYIDEEIVRDFASHITKFSPRMTTVSVLLCGSSEPLAPFLSLPGGSFSCLETLTFAETDFTGEANSSPITVFDHSPCLRDVTLSIPRHMFEGDSLLFLPWIQLTHLHVGGPLSIQSFAIVLFQCTQLHVASFPDIDLADEHETHEPVVPLSPVEFPHLTDLQLRLSGSFFMPRSNISDILDMMTFPKVSNLKLAGSTVTFRSIDGDLFPVHSIIPAPSNGFPPIRRLVLSYVHITQHELLSTLTMCPLLESLTLCLGDIHPISLLKTLTRNRSNSELNPAPPLSHLTSFTFACIMTDDNDDEFDPVVFSEAFIALVTSWIIDSERHRPLQEISLFVCHYAFHKYRRGCDGDLMEIFEKILDLTQKSIVELADDSIFTARPIGDYEELLSIFGFEEREID